MKVVADVSIVPIGTGSSTSEYIAACEKVFNEQGLQTHIHAHGTNVEGEWETVCEAVRKCHEKLHEMGVPHLDTTVRMSTRVDQEVSAGKMVESVEKQL